MEKIIRIRKNGNYFFFNAESIEALKNVIFEDFFYEKNGMLMYCEATSNLHRITTFELPLIGIIEHFSLTYCIKLIKRFENMK